MATGFSVMDALNKNSKAGIEETPRARFRTRDISIFKIYRNGMNFYKVADIEELAGDILMHGLKQNLELVYEPCEKGEYRIISGERRWEALKLLVSKGYKEFEVATCKLTAPQDADEEQVEIISANAYRTKSVRDVMEEEKRLKDSLERLRAAGKKVKGYDLDSGRLRDVIASMLRVSRTKVAQIESVNNNLIPEFKQELNNARITFSAAYELSGMPEQEQQEALGRFRESGELSHKDVKAMKEGMAGQQDAQQEILGKHEGNGLIFEGAREAELEGPKEPEAEIEMCSKCQGYPCNIKEIIKKHFMKNGNISGCAGCCWICREKGKCEYICEATKQNKMAKGDGGNQEEWQQAQPKSITSLCYSCKRYSVCNMKTSTCVSCYKYVNKAGAEKTAEQRYDEEQDRIDRETARKLREMEQERKMRQLPSETGGLHPMTHRIRLGAEFFSDAASGRKDFELRKKDRDYRVGDILEMAEFKGGQGTGRVCRKEVTYILEDYTGLEDGFCVMGCKAVPEEENGGRGNGK